AIPDAMFLDEALGLGADEDETGLDAAPAGPAPAEPAALADVQRLRGRIDETVRSVLAAAAEPVAMAKAAHEVRRTIGAQGDAPSWAGAATSGNPIAALADARLQVATGRSSNVLYDPTRHVLTQHARDRARPAGVPEVAERVNRVVGAPLLTP